MALVLALRPLLRDLTENPSVLPVLRHPAISRALVMIATRFAEPWTIESLAKEVGMSLLRLHGRLPRPRRGSPGPPPHRPPHAEAARLLCETSLPQSAVPQRVGYQSAVGFHLAFRKWFGKTPGEYRTHAASPA